MRLHYLWVIAIGAVAILALGAAVGGAVYYFVESPDGPHYDGTMTTSSTFTDEFKVENDTVVAGEKYTYLEVKVMVENTDGYMMCVSPTDFKVYVKNIPQPIVHSEGFIQNIGVGEKGTLTIRYEVPRSTCPDDVRINYSGSYSLDLRSSTIGRNAHYDASIELICTFTDSYYNSQIQTNVAAPSGCTFIEVNVHVTNGHAGPITINASDFHLYVNSFEKSQVYSNLTTAEIKTNTTGDMNIYFLVPIDTAPSSVTIDCKGDYSQYLVKPVIGTNPHYES